MDSNEEYMRGWILEWISRWGTDWVNYDDANHEMDTTPHFSKQEELGYLEISTGKLMSRDLNIRLTPKAIEFLKGGKEDSEDKETPTFMLPRKDTGDVIKGMNAYDAGKMMGMGDFTQEERIDSEIKFLNDMKARGDMLQAHKEYIVSLSEHKIKKLIATQATQATQPNQEKEQ